MLSFIILFGLVASAVYACPDHKTTPMNRYVTKRQTGTNQSANSSHDHDWSYIDSFDWGQIKPEYELCQSGTQQSPIALDLNQGLSRQHQPDFSGYLTEVTGTFYNWGHGPAFSLEHPLNQWTSLPRMRFDNETVYLKGWHTHTPADHSVSGYRSKGEIHLVHVNEEGLERAVVAVRLESGRADTNFLPDLPRLIGYNDSSVIANQTWDPRTFLQEVNYLNEFWTYKGSLTSPPCREGIQWFVARNVIYTGVEQMKQFLRVSTYSARAEQDVWLHEINV